jgi:DNA-binding beta-propeller fold protein YncE
VVATVNVGVRAYGVAYDSAKGEVFVTNRSDNTVSVISDGSSTTASTSTSASGSGGVPEFPYQLVAAAAFTLLLAASYLLVRRRTSNPGQLRRSRSTDQSQT